MTKYSSYTSREQEVLDKPDHFILRVYSVEHGWVDSMPFKVDEALKRFNAIRALQKGYRVVPYAVRVIDDDQRLAAVSPAYLSALVETDANR